MLKVNEGAPDPGTKVVFRDKVLVASGFAVISVKLLSL